jgi:DNA-binding XRE family transcriptional regulator/tetratricopeptide (TPR) repeat protein
VRSVRKRRGLTQQELATTAGLSITTIRAIEQGLKQDMRVETALKLATALRVPTSHILTRDADEGDTSPPGTRQAWEPVRRALAGQAPQPDEEPTAAGVIAAVRDLAPELSAHQYSIVRDVLPALLRDADALGDESGARRVHAELLATTGYLLVQTRQFAVAEMTLNRAIDAAGDRLDAASAADSLCWLYLRQGRLTEALATAARWADDLEPPRFSRATVRELMTWSRFLLSIANAATRDNRPGEAEDALQLAGAAAARMGREVQRHPHSQMVYGPVTHQYIVAETRVLTGRPDAALKIADALPPVPAFPGLVSRLRHRLDVANAYACTRRYPESVAVLSEVRQRAPEWLAQQHYARDILGHVVDKRRSLTPEMRELADVVRLPL